jgi:hypothetical protein
LKQSCNPILTLGGRVGQATTVAVLAVAAVGSGLFFGWNSIVALGLSTVVISLLPCLAMCALGICAARMGKKDVGAASPAPKDAGTPHVTTAESTKTR